MLWQRGQAVIPRGKGRRRMRRQKPEEAFMPKSASQSQRIAVIGLGSMGFGMASSLRRAGFEVTGCDVSDDAVARFVADGGKGAKSPGEAARSADIVVSVVVNAAQTETILFGKDGVAETLGNGAASRSVTTRE